MANDPATLLVRGENNHGVAKAFIDFMNQEGLVSENGRFAQGKVRLAAVRPEPDGLLEFPDRVVVFALGRERDAEVCVRFGVVRPEPHGLAVLPHRPVDVALGLERACQNQPQDRVVRLLFEAGPYDCQRLVKLFIAQMQIGQAKFGMQTLNQSLCDLYIRKVISLDECLGHSSELEELKTMILNAGGSLGSHGSPAQPGRRG